LEIISAKVCTDYKSNLFPHKSLSKVKVFSRHEVSFKACYSRINTGRPYRKKAKLIKLLFQRREIKLIRILAILKELVKLLLFFSYP
jgi:hypothetical protein